MEQNVSQTTASDSKQKSADTLHNLLQSLGQNEAKPNKPLSKLAEQVVKTFEREEQEINERKISVNPVVAKFAAWYEKLRNAMEIRDEEVILRSSIERILKRRLLLGGNAQTTAEPLVRELIWARYLADASVPESMVQKVEHTIDLWLQLRFKVINQRKFSVSVLNQWIYHLMSSDLVHLLSPNVEKETVNNFMYQILKEDVTLEGESEETKNAQVYLAVRRAFSKDDLAFLRFHLFSLFFGRLTAESLDHIAEGFMDGYSEIVKQLSYRSRERVYIYVRRRAAAFLILEDVMRVHKSSVRSFIQDEASFKDAVMAACESKYKNISQKVRTAIIRSVIFILTTKVIFAFMVEGTYERIVYGYINFLALGINTGIPPLLMIIVSFFIHTPGQENSDRIYDYIDKLLHVDNPIYGSPLFIKAGKEKRTVLTVVFAVLWFLAFVISFGFVYIVLNDLQFNIVSKGIFIFFLAVVSFLSYRITLTANLYRLGEKQGLLTPLIDFFFMPVVRVGRKFTEGIAQINFLLFVFDFLIETPFKSVFAFAEQWFRFLHDKREELG